MDWKAVQKKVAAAIGNLGMTVTVKRDGATVCRGSAVFAKSKAEDLPAAGLPGVTQATGTTKTLVFTPTVKRAPEVGDTVESSQGSFQVSAVEQCNPAGTVLVYKLSLS